MIQQSEAKVMVREQSSIQVNKHKEDDNEHNPVKCSCLPPVKHGAVRAIVTLCCTDTSPRCLLHWAYRDQSQLSNRLRYHKK